MLILMKNNEPFSQVADGAALHLDGLFVSPAYAGWSHGEYNLVEAPPPPEPTPEEARAALPAITRRQLRLTLVRNGISLSDVTQALDAMPDGLAKEEAEIEWEDAATFERLHPTLLAIADALSLSPEAVDDMWHQAMEA